MAGEAAKAADKLKGLLGDDNKPRYPYYYEEMEPNVEEAFADALLRCEPPKVEGGSKKRQDWLGLVVEIMIYLHEHDGDAKRFQLYLLGE